MASNINVNNSEVEKILEDENLLSKKDRLQRDFAQVDEDFVSGINSVNNIDKNAYEKSQVELERKEFNPISDEELQEIAKNSLNDYYENSKSSIQQDNEKQIEALNSKSEKAKNKAFESHQKLAQQIAGAKENAKNEAINRGLARSSIIMKQIEGYDDKIIKESANIEKNLNNSLIEISSQIDSLNAMMENSLKNLDIAYAVKLQAKINDLKEAQEKKREEALEYNNEQALKAAKFNAEQNEKYEKYLESASKNGNNNFSSNNQNENNISKQKYLLAQDYFSSLNKQDALNELLGVDKDYYKENLGAFFYKLFQEIRDR